MRRFLVCLSAILLSAMALSQSNPLLLINQSAGVVAPISASPKAQVKILDSYGKLPLGFEANQGQTDSRVKFLSRTSGYSLFLTADEAVLALRGKKANTHNAKIASASQELQSGMTATTTCGVLRMKLRNASAAAEVTGVDELPGKSNYFTGNDSKKWRSNVPTYAKVKYQGVYSGIDLVYYGNRRQLEYDFVVAPGADPHRIQFDVGGAKRIHRDKNGDLVLQMSDGEVRWHKPVVYQEKDGEKQEINGHYVIKHGQRVGFELAGYDSKKPLTIDPVLVYSTYLGGSDFDYGSAIAVDSAGNAYVTGITNSGNFPTVNPLQPTYGGGTHDWGYGDAFVAKLNPSGSALVYSTYLGGSRDDAGYGIAVDSAGDAYVTGLTVSRDFPMMNPLQPAYGGDDPDYGSGDAFVAKLNPSGSALVYSTYLGGSSEDLGYSIAVDSSGDAYVTGATTSRNFPTMNPLQTTCDFCPLEYHAFVAKLNPSGSALVYSTYLGGNNYDDGLGIAADDSGNAYVTGYTASTNFPTMNPLQPSNGGWYDAFVTKVNPSGSALVYSTYLGGSGYDSGSAIAVDSFGNPYVTGVTGSTDFPTTLGAFQTTSNGSGDAFVAKLNPSGSALVYSTYLGGSGADDGYGIAVDSAGDAYVTGVTISTDFPTMNPLQPAYGGGQFDGFVTKLNPSGSALVYSTYLGGSGPDYGSAIAVDSFGNPYVTGVTGSTDFPTMNPLQPAYSGSDDAFVAKISPYKAFVQQPINADGSSIFRANRGVVPVKFTLTENGTPTCALPPATIAVTRTAGGTLGSVDESTYSTQADGGSNFRIDQTACQYVYNLAASSLGVGTYEVDISINGNVVGNAFFAFK
ncbi:MAG: SBBP repeat-containing protein [Acidobacteriia bacterium]|nr:SBBP repeat-containing protein [Terriglobia bacterium]